MATSTQNVIDVVAIQSDSLLVDDLEVDYIDVDAVDEDAIEVDKDDNMIIDPLNVDTIKQSFQSTFSRELAEGLNACIERFATNCRNLILATELPWELESTYSTRIVLAADAGLQALWDRITFEPSSLYDEALGRAIDALAEVMTCIHHPREELNWKDENINFLLQTRLTSYTFSFATLFYNYRKLRAWSGSPGSLRRIPLVVYPSDKLDRSALADIIISMSQEKQVILLNELVEDPTKGSTQHGLFGDILCEGFPPSPSDSIDGLIPGNTPLSMLASASGPTSQDQRLVLRIPKRVTSQSSLTPPALPSLSNHKPPLPKTIPFFRCNYCNVTVPRKSTRRDPFDDEGRKLWCAACLEYMRALGRHRPKLIINRARAKNPERYDNMSLLSVCPIGAFPGPETAEASASASELQSELPSTATEMRPSSAGLQVLALAEEGVPALAMEIDVPNKDLAAVVEDPGASPLFGKDSATNTDPNDDVNTSSPSSIISKTQLRRLKGPILEKHTDGSDLPKFVTLTVWLLEEDLSRRLVLRCFDRKLGLDDDDDAWQLAAPTAWPTDYHLAVQGRVNQGTGFKLSPALPPDLNYHTRDMSIEEIPINHMLQVGMNMVEFLFMRPCGSKMFVLESWS